MSIYRQFLFELRYIPHSLYLMADFKQKAADFLGLLLISSLVHPQSVEPFLNIRHLDPVYVTNWNR